MITRRSLALLILFCSSHAGASPAKRGRERVAAERAISFLIADAAKWRKERECSTCHHGTLTVWALAEAKSRGFEVAERALPEMADWTKSRLLARLDLPRDTRPGWSMVNTAAMNLSMMALGLPEQDAVDEDELRRIGDHLVRHQEGDGSWAWSSAPPQNRAPPFFESDEVATLFATMAMRGRTEAEPLEAGLQGSRDRALAWLRGSPESDTTQANAYRLTLSVYLRAPAKATGSHLNRLLQRQNADGGWGQVPGAKSDAYATGQALYALNVAGRSKHRAEVRRGVSFLLSSQLEDGSWRMSARAHPGAKPSSNVGPIVHLGSAWATIGLLRFLGVTEATAAAPIDL